VSEQAFVPPTPENVGAATSGQQPGPNPASAASSESSQSSASSESSELLAPSAPSAPAEHILRNRGFLKLWGAQVVSSLGDWIGLLAILNMAQRVSGSAAVGFVMTARMLPGFLLAPLGGALLDRWDRRRVMIVCDVGRAALLVALPFLDTVIGLVVMSFALEVLSLLWGPAKDASVPNVVRDDQLPAANSLGLVAAWGTFPLGAVVFAVLASLARWLGGFSALDRFSVDQESVAIWFDALTFIGSAMLILRMRLPRIAREDRQRVPWMQTYRDMVEGLAFIRRQPMVRGAMIGIAGGLLGGGAMIPLGPAYSKDVLGGGAAGFSVLMIALGLGAGIGVPTLLWLQRRLPLDRAFFIGVVATGVLIVSVALVSTFSSALIIVAGVGAAAASAYVTGFSLLQREVVDELRGRIFGALYTIVRLSLLASLTVGPFMASAFDAISKAAIDRELSVGSYSLALPGVRLALIAGGGITIVAGVAARRRMRRAAVAP
jgi:dTMP kinase